MNRERLYRTDAIILRRSDHKEADRLLTVFTPKLGKLKLVAKGVRKITSRKAGHIELFMLTDMQIARSRTWDIVTQVQVLQTYRGLREDLDKTSQAYYMAELIDCFVEEADANLSLFELFAFTLAHLAHATDSFLLLRYFEIHLLRLTGFQPQLHFCLACNQPLQPVDNFFHFGDGGTFCPLHGQGKAKAQPIPLATLKVLRFLQTQPWENVSGLQLTPRTSYQTENLLLGYITHTLERRLKSVAFIHKLRKGMK
ncbi:DNA repair protein RecO [Anaerolineales bacterium HSG24]|nr:DNA repair protein RecO [Anaerolineales bacterium HSG24]